MSGVPTDQHLASHLKSRAASRGAEIDAQQRFQYRRLHLGEVSLLNRLYNSYYRDNRPLEEALWLYAQNPLGAATVFGAFDEGGQLVGMRPCIPFKLWWNGEERRAYEFADALVHPRYQRRGIFSELLRMACEEAGEQGHVLYSLPNEQSLAVYRQSPSLQALGDIVTIARPLSLRYLTDRLRRGDRGERCGVAERADSEVADGDTRIVWVKRFEHDFAEVHRELRLRGLSYSLRSRDFLQWRYFGSPVRQYDVGLLKEGEHLHGYVVMRILSGIAHVVDFFVRPQPDLVHRALMLATRWAGQAGATGIHFSAAGTALFREATMKNALWLKRRPRRFVVSRPSRGAGGYDPTLAEMYFVMGDFDFL